jgi:hypothetical protein
MSKRGAVELVVLLAVVSVAVLAGVYLFAGTPSTGMSYVSHTEYPPAGGIYQTYVSNPYLPVVQAPGELEMTSLDCQSYCFGRPAGVPRYSYPGGSAGGQSLRECLAACQQQTGAVDINQLP